MFKVIVEWTLNKDARLSLTTQRQIFQNVSRETVSDLPRDSTPSSYLSLTLTLFGGAVLFVWFKSCLLCSTILYFFFLHNICDTPSVITVFVFHCCTSTDWLYNVLRPSTNQSFVSGKPYYYFDSTLRNDRLMAVLQAVNNRYLLQIYYSGCRRFK